MKFGTIFLSLLIVMTSSYSQSLSIGINHNVTPIISLDLLNERLSIDLGCGYDKISSERSSFDSSWTVSPGYTYEYSFESVWDYTVQTISPSAKLRYSFLPANQTHPYIYLSVIKPIVDVDGEFYFKSGSGIDDYSKERKKELELLYGGMTYSAGIGATSKVNDKIRLLFDFGYYSNSSESEHSESSGDASNGELSREKSSNSRGGLSSSISVLYMF